MPLGHVDDGVIRVLADYVRFYEGKDPNRAVLRTFVERKCRERDVVESYDERDISRDDVCHWLLSHVHAKFVWSTDAMQDEPTRRFQRELKDQLFWF